MRELPILFSAPMVRAILEGRKTVTRRIVNPQPTRETTSWHRDCSGSGRWMALGPAPATSGTRQTMPWAPCPYGQPGDRLWVRESLGYDAEYGHYYAAGGRHGETVHLCELFDDPESETGYSYDGNIPDRGIPSIHLPRRYSRITLEVTGVRVERLQDISEHQAKAEGIPPGGPTGMSFGIPGMSRAHYLGTAREAFSVLWGDINGAGSWDANPWVWAVEFSRIEQPRKAA
ncbi:hypothetical protein [Dyella sp.]|uniref:hypothetical protein n=1 Tax=Dyella sp. TaxID=1869338 RepID=UPI0028517917|nr:hypothetical protein [Dyella sp.]MDR3444731.1 hypothetical protein [Dyella sp.]